MPSYFTCSICDRVATLDAHQIRCPYCGSLSGEFSSEPPRFQKGTIGPIDKSVESPRRDSSKG